MWSLTRGGLGASPGELGSPTTVQNNHTVHRPQLASEVLSILFLRQHRAVGISSTLQPYQRFFQILHYRFVSEQMLRKHEAITNQINLWHKIMQHKSVLYSQNWFPLTSCRALASLHPSYLLRNEAHLYNTGGKNKTATKNINPCNILSSYQHYIFLHLTLPELWLRRWDLFVWWASVQRRWLSICTQGNAYSTTHRISAWALLKSWTNWQISPKSSWESWSAGSPNLTLTREEKQKQDELTNLTNLKCDQIYFTINNCLRFHEWAGAWVVHTLLNKDVITSYTFSACNPYHELYNKEDVHCRIIPTF